MENVKINADCYKYVINIDNNLLSSIKIDKGFVIVTDDIVHNLYGKYFKGAKFVVLKAGEESKNMENLQYIYKELMDAKLNREDYLIALGGGVIGDITGFAAATFKRGVNFIQIPTTLLAQVDSSVGGKVAVNIPQGKNMVGAFYQPKAVYADISTLQTLDKRQISAGMAEVIKYGYIADKEFIASIKNLSLAQIVKRSCEIKGEFVHKDPYDTGERMKLNYGHTIGHAIETVTGYNTYLHGEGVAIGMAYASQIAENLGIAKSGLHKNTIEMLEFYNLPTKVPKEVLTSALNILEHDKKAQSDGINFILIETVGNSIIKKLKLDTIKEALNI